MSTRAELLVLVDALVGVGSNIVSKAEHEVLLEDFVSSLLNLEDDAGLLIGGVVGLYDPSKTYTAGQGVFSLGQIFQLNEDITVPEVFDVSKWTQKTGLIKPSDYGFTVWDNATNYVGGNLVEDENITYRALGANINKKPTLNPGDWELLPANNGILGNAHQNGLFKPGQVITDVPNKKMYELVNVADPFESTDLAAEITGGDWVLFNDTGSLSDAEVKTKYENNADTNAFTDAEQTNLGNQSNTNTGDEVQATESESGISERATQSETNTGTDDLRHVTPLKLKTNLVNKILLTKSGVLISGNFSGNPKIATVTFGTAFADANYSISAIGVDSRAWSIQSVVAGSFVINSNSNTVLTGDVHWTAIKHGETT